MWRKIFDYSGIRWLFVRTNWRWVESLYFEIAARAWHEEDVAEEGN